MKLFWARLVLWWKGYCFKHDRWPTRECVETREQLEAYDAGRYIGQYGELVRSLSCTSHGECPECQVIQCEKKREASVRSSKRLEEMRQAVGWRGRNA